ncbi:MAG: hypothetical protein OXG24_03000 [Gammaproteobacteria bacterium]|nr:hypothetical protein [Gammaproteobacteria bacterium]
MKNLFLTLTIALVLSQLSGCMAVFKLIQSEATITHQLDDLVVMKTARSLLRRDRGLIFEICKTFYKSYQDVFDVIIVVSNIPKDVFDNSKIGYHGAMATVRNVEIGTGASQFDHGDMFFSRNSLRGVMHLPSANLLMGGPSLHEFMHLWVVDREVIPTVLEAHWGFSSVHGQLGGFDLDNLVDLGEGKYSAGVFGINANFGNSLPYAPLELYLAGWIAAEEVPDIWVAEDGEYQFEVDPSNRDKKKIQQGPDGSPIFTATNTSIWSIDQIVDVLGERIPNVRDSQKEFRVAVVLVGNEDFPVTDEDIEFLRTQVALFSSKSSLRTSKEPGMYNFWDATGGRASIHTDGLNDLQRHPEYN